MSIKQKRKPFEYTQLREAFSKKFGIPATRTAIAEFIGLSRDVIKKLERNKMKGTLEDCLVRMYLGEQSRGHISDICLDKLVQQAQELNTGY